MNVHEAASPFSRRRHARLNLPEEQRAVVRIVAIDRAELASPPGLVKLRNVGEGGCCFSSELKFPVHPRILLEIAWAFRDQGVKLVGQVVWRIREEEGYRYGMQFRLASAERSHLIGHLNEMLLHLCPGQTRIHAIYRKLTAAPLQARGKEAPP